MLSVALNNNIIVHYNSNECGKRQRWPLSKYWLGNLGEGIRKTMEIFSEDNLCPGRNFKHATPGYSTNMTDKLQQLRKLLEELADMFFPMGI
jgi:hypothetical protein